MEVCPPMSTTEVSMVDTPTTTASVMPRQNLMLGAMAMVVSPPMSTTEVSMEDTPTTMESVMLMPSPMHTFTETPMVVSTVTLQFTTAEKYLLSSGLNCNAFQKNLSKKNNSV